MAKTCLVLNRWTDDFSHYEKIIDHHQYNVAYVTVREHAERLPPGLARHVETIETLDVRDSVIAAAMRCRSALNRIDHVVALSEFDLLLGAELRQILGVPGYKSSDVFRFRDKIAMKQSVREMGIAVPRYADLDNDAAVETLVREVGFPLIVKPRAGAASEQCNIARDTSTLGRLRRERRGKGHECEEYVDGPIYHVDGLVDNRRLLFVKASRYINTCYDFAHGKPLGSVIIDDAESEPLIQFTQRTLEALGLDRGAFHLEVIEGRHGLCFLEIGARVGGGEIPFVIHDLFGVDLIGDWLRIDLEQQPTTVESSDSEAPVLGGFLMIPEPVGSRLVARNSPIGSVNGLYDAVLPEIGHRFDGKGGYENILGRFRYRGASRQAIEAAIHRTLSLYHYELSWQDDIVGDSMVDGAAT